MYINYLNDRKLLGYKCLADTQDENRFVLITDSRVVFLRMLLWMKSIKFLWLLDFSNVKSAEAIGTNLSPQQTIVNITYWDASRLIKPSKIKINSDIEPKIMMPSLSNSIGSVRIRLKSDLQNSQWLKEFVSTIREEIILNIMIQTVLSQQPLLQIRGILSVLAKRQTI